MLHNQLAIITVVYQNYNILDDFLKSLGSQKNRNFKLFISDLSDNKQETGHRAAPDFAFETINGNNRGYAYGVNLGLKKAITQGHDVFCVINNDTYFNNSFVGSVLSSIINHPSSIIGGKIYYAPGYEYHKDRYQKNDSGKVFWYAGGRVDWKHALTPHRGVDNIDKGQYDKFENTEFVNGCLMCFDKKVVDKIGFWDKKYFLYFEDADFCERAKRVNISLYYDPSIVIWHKNAQSTGGAGSKLHQKFQKINRLRFGLHYAPLKTKFHLLKNYFLS